MPFSSLLGLNTADSYEKLGLDVGGVLAGKKIYPLYSVWPPTQVHVYKLFREMLLESQHLSLGSKNAIDIGSGTGILGFQLALAGPNIEVFAFDK
jgi:hypothetical protein